MSYICVRFRRISRDSVLTFRPIRRAISFLTSRKQRSTICQKPRRVSPPQRRKIFQSFSPATCASEKIHLGLQTCAPSANGGQCVRCSQAANPFVKKEYFLTVSKTAKHDRASLFFDGVKFCAPALHSARRAPSADTAAGAGRAAAPSGRTGRARPAGTA